MLKFLLIFFIIIYLLSFIGKWFFTSLVNKATSGSHFNSGQQNNRPEGDVSVQKEPQKSKLFKKDDGEYVDYEEVKE